MNDENYHFVIVEEFFARFYHEEPDDMLASTKALRAMTGHSKYEWKIAHAIEVILSQEWADETLQNLVKRWANRHVESETEARDFIKKVYDDNNFSAAYNIDDLTD